MKPRLVSTCCNCGWPPAARTPCTNAEFWAPCPTSASSGRPELSPGAACGPAMDGSAAPMVSPARLPRAMPLRTKRRSTLMTVSSRLLYQRQGPNVLGHLGDGFIIDIGCRECGHGIEAIAHDGLYIGLGQPAATQRWPHIDLRRVAMTANVFVKVLTTAPLGLVRRLRCSAQQRQRQNHPCRQNTPG